MKSIFEIDGYTLEKGTQGNPEYLTFCGDMADQLQILLAEITRPGGEGEINLAQIRKGIGRPGPGIAYEAYPLGSRFLDCAEFDAFQSWWNANNDTPLQGPIWTAMVEWIPNAEGYIPHGTLLKILDLQMSLKSKG